MRVLVVIGLVAAGIASAVLSSYVFQSHMTWPEKLAAEADVLTGLGLFFAFLAAVAAAAAYRAATGKAKLKSTLRLPRLGEPERLSLKVQFVPDAAAWQIERPPIDDLQLFVVLENRAEFVARNPAVRLSLLGFTNVAAQKDWSPWPDAPPAGVTYHTTLEWQGSPTESVHKEWPRGLPPIDLSGARIAAVDRKVVGVSVKAIADGCKPFREGVRRVQIEGIPS